MITLSIRRNSVYLVLPDERAALSSMAMKVITPVWTSVYRERLVQVALQVGSSLARPDGWKRRDEGWDCMINSATFFGRSTPDTRPKLQGSKKRKRGCPTGELVGKLEWKQANSAVGKLIANQKKLAGAGGGSDKARII